MPKLKMTIKILKWASIVLLSLLILLIALAFIFENKIKQYAIKYINQYVTTEINVKDISFSFIEKFPQASLNFKNVLILDPPDISRKKDTLLYADNIYLQFNIWDIFSEKYTVKSIACNDAIVKLFVDNTSKENYMIWKNDTTSKNEGNFSFALEQVKFRHLNVRYNNLYKETDFSIYADKLNFYGAFDKKNSDLKISSKKISLNQLKFNNYNLTKKYELDFNLEMIIDNTQNIIKIKKSKIHFEKMKFTADGMLGISPNSDVNLNIKGDDINIQEVTESFKNLFSDNITNYETSGTIDFNANIKKQKDGEPEIKTTFNLENGTIKEKKSALTIQQLSFNGLYNNMDANGGRLQIKNMKGYLEKSFFELAITVAELNKPKIDCYVKANIDLETFYNFFKPDNIKKASGIIDCNFTFNLNYTNDNNKFTLKNAEGYLKIENVNLHSSVYKHSLQKCNGIFKLKNSQANIDDFTANIGSSNIILNGAIQNFLEYYLGIEDKLNIVAQVKSDSMNLNELLQADETNSASNPEQINLALPDNINLNLDLRIKKLEKDKFLASNLSLKMILLDKKLYIKDFISDYANGRISGNMEIDGTFSNLFGFTADMNIKQVDIQEVFRQFNDFGQRPQSTFISYKNINGKINSEASLGGLFDNELNIEKNKFFLTADMLVENGELINVNSLIEVAKYLKNDKKIRLALGSRSLEEIEKKLTHVKFSNLVNHIDIKNQTVYIPKMDISSNVLNLKFSGTHTFNNDMDYRFNFRFNELKVQNKQTEYGYIIDDGTGIKIYVHMFGNADNLAFELDKNSLKEDIQEYNQQELKNIKGILKNELGLFNKDSSAVIKETPKQQVKFLIESELKNTDEANQERDDKNANHEKANKKTNKLKQKWGNDSVKNKTKIIIEQ
jgi:hypothetical protein